MEIELHDLNGNVVETIELEDDIVAAIERIAVRRGCTFEEALQDSVTKALDRVRERDADIRAEAGNTEY